MKKLPFKRRMPQGIKLGTLVHKDKDAKADRKQAKIKLNGLTSRKGSGKLLGIDEDHEQG